MNDLISNTEGLIVGRPAPKKKRVVRPAPKPIHKPKTQPEQKKEPEQKAKPALNILILPIIFYAAAFVSEIILKIFLGGWSIRAVWLIAVFSLVWAFIGFLISFLPRLAARITATVFCAILAVLFITQFALIQIRDLPASFAQMGMVKSEVGPVITAFWQELGQNWPIVVAFLAVAGAAIFAVWFFNFSHLKMQKWWQTIVFTLGVIIALTGVVFLTLQTFGKKFGSPNYLYFESSDMRAQVRELGLIATETIDIRQVMLGFEPTVIAAADPTAHGPLADDYAPQTTLDLVAVAKTQPKKLAEISQALAGSSPSYTNAHTGLLKDKNLILIVAESFNSAAVDETLTPNLYQMANSGFVFDNFYSPYILSTIGGEFQVLTGLLPTQTLLKTWRDGETTFPLAIGNSFAENGFDAKSSYTLTESSYYDRVATRPTLGFSDFLACGQGMDALVGARTCSQWIQSDTELIDTVLPFITEKAKARNDDGSRIPFATYLLTMSGHGEYSSWNDQWVANRHKKAVAKLSLSTQAKIYQASQIELDLAVGKLVEGLRNAGELDNTVIVLAGDHYPYMMSLDNLNELSTYERDATIEANRSNLIIWNPSMPTARVEKVGSSADILPTLLNLWGIKFDSRLMMGRDILDESASGLAIFADRSWVSDYGRYYASKKLFVPREGLDAAAIPANYAQLINQLVASRFNLSETIVQNNYYTSLAF
ncbi:MAG: sulfatase-like hydrolase/transferase [Candidatus Nomurabacteria bacterium]|jgi:phosphoglycerol transferase MdoB-like AlkP superfamily enzyme|nr:sulfatase-like hydrolase/transferase [Candidatus Nomurabacteria bacterium]